MLVLSVLEAPNTKPNSLCVQTHLALSDSDSDSENNVRDGQLWSWRE